MASVDRRRRRWVRFIPFAVLCLFLALAFVYQQGLEARATVGEAAPAFTLPSLRGGEVDLAQYRGRPVVLNFWTTWCTECEAEVGLLEEVHRSLVGRVQVVGVDMREPAGIVRPFVEQHGMSYPVLLDRSKTVSRSYRVTGVPETWIIDSSGAAVRHYVGPVSSEELRRALGELGIEGGT